MCIVSFFSCKKEEKVDEVPSIEFTYSNNIGTMPRAVTFTATPSEAGTVEWNFGDGGVATGESVTHNYSSPGFFSVEARLITSERSVSRTRNVNVSKYTALRINNINGTSPLLKSNGTTWDSGPFNDTVPDLYFRVFTASGAELGPLGGYTHFNNVYSTNYPYVPPIDITDFDNPFTVKFLDFDDGSINDDLIALLTFRAADYFVSSGPFPIAWQKQDLVNGGTVTVYVTWVN